MGNEIRKEIVKGQMSELAVYNTQLFTLYTLSKTDFDEKQLLKSANHEVRKSYEIYLILIESLCNHTGEIEVFRMRWLVRFYRVR